MRITLLKARKLEKQINTFIERTWLNEYRYSVFKDLDNIKNEFSKNRFNFTAKYVDYIELIELRYFIRNMISKNNDFCKIDELLCNRQKLKQIVTFITGIIESNLRLIEDGICSPDVIKMKAGKALESDSQPQYQETNSIRYSVIDEADIDQYRMKIDNCNAEISNIDDDILALNSTKEIELSEKQVALLKKYNILN